MIVKGSNRSNNGRNFIWFFVFLNVVHAYYFVHGLCVYFLCRFISIRKVAGESRQARRAAVIFGVLTLVFAGAIVFIVIYFYTAIAYM